MRGAGSFRVLRASGSVRSGGVLARTRHRFTPRFVETRWTVRGAGSGGSVDVLFPSWGRGARVVAVREDGSRTVVGRRPVRLGDVAYLHVQSARAAYVVVPLRRAGVVARTVRPRRQSSAPDPGPTLALRLRRPRMAVRLAPVGGDADALATHLRLFATRP